MTVDRQLASSLAPLATDKPSPEAWGRRQAAQAPPWTEAQWERATASLGILIPFGTPGGEGCSIEA